MSRNWLYATTTSAAILVSSILSLPAKAVDINDLFVFGDSYSDTGAYVELSNGPTAVGYLAQDFDITLTTSKNADPGTDGVNFAESGARVFVGPNPPATQPRSLTQQVAEFQNYVDNDKVTFNPSTSLFFLLGGLTTIQSPRPKSMRRRLRRSLLSTRSAHVSSRSRCCRRQFRHSLIAPTISIPVTKRWSQSFRLNIRTPRSI